MTAQEIISSPHLAKLTVKDFLVLANSGAFDRYARTELIEGEIWAVNAIHRRHARIHGKLVAELGAAMKLLDSKLDVLVAPSIELSQDSLPEPDIAIAPPGDDKVLQGPTVLLAIEIADTTLDTDLGRKAALYARHEVPEYWVVDVECRVIYQFWSPANGKFADNRETAFGELVTAATIAGLIVETLAL